MAEIAYVALGSNLGDRARHLAGARAAIAELPGTRVIAESDVEETEPLPAPSAVSAGGPSVTSAGDPARGALPEGPYLNQMLAIETELEPEALLTALQEIEAAHGRMRRERWAPRTLDIDIVRYGDRRIATPQLTVPHPELERRDFWLRELAQVERR